MFLGKVIGTVWSSVKWKELGGLKLMVVRPYTAKDLQAGASGSGVPVAPTHDAVVCADVLDSGIGDEVVVAYGHAARVAISEAEALAGGQKPSVPVDAAIVAVVDRFDTSAPEAAPGDGG